MLLARMINNFVPFVFLNEDIVRETNVPELYEI